MVVGLPPVPPPDLGRAMGGHPGGAEPCGDCARQTPDDRQHRNMRPSSCGGRKRATPKEALGRSRGGFSTKIHLHVNGAGLPMRTEITPGQDSDYTGYDLIMADNLPQAGNPLRPNRRQFPRLRRRCLHQAMAPPFVNTA